MIIFTIIIFLILSGVIYTLLIFTTRIVRSFKKVETRKKYGVSIFIASCFIAALATFYFLFNSPAKNYHTAYIETDQYGYRVTIGGKRSQMAHDPITPFLRRTFEDSAQFILPRKAGMIQANELKTVDNPNNFVGNIFIEGEHMKVNLTFDKRTYSNYSWNGDYMLVWRKQ